MFFHILRLGSAHAQARSMRTRVRMRVYSKKGAYLDRQKMKTLFVFASYLYILQFAVVEGIIISCLLLSSRITVRHDYKRALLSHSENILLLR